MATSSKVMLTTAFFHYLVSRSVVADLWLFSINVSKKWTSEGATRENKKKGDEQDPVYLELSSKKTDGLQATLMALRNFWCVSIRCRRKGWPHIGPFLAPQSYVSFGNLQAGCALKDADSNCRSVAILESRSGHESYHQKPIDNLLLVSDLQLLSLSASWLPISGLWIPSMAMP